MLSDCNHAQEVVIPRIIDNLNRHGYVEMNKAAKVTVFLNFIFYEVSWAYTCYVTQL